jgi:alkylation response protein AidB-like acyl-CoA dehydrogenase
MKISLLFALAALAIGLAVRAFALSGNLAEDVKAFDEFQALRMKVGEAFTNNDAVALAALFTEARSWWNRKGCLTAGRP